MRPYFIEQRLKLRQPMYSETAAYGHMGRENKVVTKTFTIPNAKSKTMEVELFTWEKLDFVEKVKNAFSNSLLSQLRNLFVDADKDDNVRCVLITGGPDVFAAGSDISQLQDRPMYGGVADERYDNWDTMERFSKPLVAAVNGYALGGGCELAMLADIAIAGDSAKFGLPELRLGLFPGLGGTQRFIRESRTLSRQYQQMAQFQNLLPIVPFGQAIKRIHTEHEHQHTVPCLKFGECINRIRHSIPL